MRSLLIQKMTLAMTTFFTLLLLLSPFQVESILTLRNCYYTTRYPTRITSFISSNGGSITRTLFDITDWKKYDRMKITTTSTGSINTMILKNTKNDYNVEIKSSSSSSTTAATAALEFIRQCGKLKTTTRAGWVQRDILKTMIKRTDETTHLESVADHSWRVSAMCLLLLSSSTSTSTSTSPKKGSSSTNDENEKYANNVYSSSINVEKCMQMAILHDLAECITGDICPADNITKEDKYELELNAIHQMISILEIAEQGNPNSTNSSITTTTGSASSYLWKLWNEYETRQSEEAKVVKDLDLLEMIVQADEYEQIMGGDHCDTLQEFFDGTQPSRFQNDYVKSLAEELHLQRTKRLHPYQKANTNTNANSTLGSNNVNTKHNIPGTVKEDERRVFSSKENTEHKQKEEKTLSKVDWEFIDKYSKVSKLSKEEIEDVILAYTQAKQ